MNQGVVGDRGTRTNIRRRLLDLEPVYAIPGLSLLIIPNSFWWLGLIVALFPWVLRWRLRGSASRQTPFDAAIVLLLVGVLVGLYTAVDTRLAVEAMRGYLGAALGFYLLVNNDHPRWIRAYLVLFAFVATIATVWTFSVWAADPNKVTVVNAWLQSYLGQLQPLPWVKGASPHLNSLASVLQVVITLLVAEAIFGMYRGWRLVFGIWALLLTIAAFLTSSRAGWLALLTSLLVLGVRRTRWAMVALPVLLGAAYLILRQELAGVEGLLVILSGQTVVDRISLWRETWFMLQDLFFTGTGPGNFAVVYPLYSIRFPFTGVENNPHNGFLQLYSDAGILGILASVWLLAIEASLAVSILAKHRGSQRHPLAIGAIAGALGWFVYAIFESAVGLVFADSSGQYHYLISPFPWILAAFTLSGLRQIGILKEKHHPNL